MPVYNIPPSPIPTSSSFDQAEVGVKPEKELTKDDIFGNVNSFEYSVSGFCPGLSKVVRTKSKDRYFFTPYKKSADEFKYDDKLDSSISRTRRLVLECALCNDWKWFGTLTIDADKEDRDDLQAFYKHFTENWLKYQREKTGKKIPYLLVPERHKKRGWHIHGMFTSDIDDLLVSFAELDQSGFRSANGKCLPRRLIRGEYYDWPAYRKRFGFCSFGKIRDKQRCGFYVSKYITKSLVLNNNDLLGKQTFYHSEGLNKAVLLGRVYANTSALDAVIDRHYEFCSTGWFHSDPELRYDPLLDIIEERGDVLLKTDKRLFDILGQTDGIYLPDPLKIDSYPPDVQAEVDAYYEATQLAIKGFEVKDGKTKVSKGSARL